MWETFPSLDFIIPAFLSLLRLDSFARWVTLSHDCKHHLNDNGLQIYFQPCVSDSLWDNYPWTSAGHRTWDTQNPNINCPSETSPHLSVFLISVNNPNFDIHCLSRKLWILDSAFSSMLPSNQSESAVVPVQIWLLRVGSFSQICHHYFIKSTDEITNKYQYVFKNIYYSTVNMRSEYNED